jgi:transcription-repair coupling factor (superfamily II helicase)
MAAVGLDLYIQMVEQAVQQMKGEEVEEEIDPTLRLNVSAFIPDDYVEDAQQRLSLYKRLSASQKIGDLALLHEETQDRYGSLPDAVERLFEVMQIRLLAKKLRLESLETNKGKIVLTQNSKAKIPQKCFDWLTQYTEENLKFISTLSVEIDTEQENWAGLVGELNTILQGLLNASAKTIQV